MPLYDYRCQSCAHLFEALVRSGETVACPSCGKSDLERLLSHFAVSSEGTRQSNLTAARRRLSTSKDTIDKQVAEQEEVHHHMNEHS